MNRFILKHGYLVTFVILAVLAWAAYWQVSTRGSGLITEAVVAVILWALGTFVFIYFWPRITYGAYKRAILQHGLGGGSVPVNTLYAAPTISSPRRQTAA
jgi:hypothetical protein